MRAPVHAGEEFSFPLRLRSNAPETVAISRAIMSVAAPVPAKSHHQVATLEVDTHDKLVLSAGGHSLALGSRAGTLSGGDGPIPAFAAEPGDTTSATLERSGLSWPTPLETNFMTGQTPSWRRHVYYRLSWKKAYGTRDQAEFGCKPSNIPGTACRSICPNASWCFEHLSDVQPALRKACKCSRL